MTISTDDQRLESQLERNQEFKFQYNNVIIAYL